MVWGNVRRKGRNFIGGVRDDRNLSIVPQAGTGCTGFCTKNYLSPVIYL